MQAGGPPHMEFELSGGIPATLYLPGSGNPFFALQPLPPDKRRPAVLLVHGFSSDRALMSVLARRIARNGYACLTIDLPGHGHNRNPFARNFGSETLRQDLTTAVNFLRTSSYVDGSRIVVIGHSMGANAALDYAAHDPNIKGSVMISVAFASTVPIIRATRSLSSPKTILSLFGTPRSRSPGFWRAPDRSSSERYMATPPAEPRSKRCEFLTPITLRSRARPSPPPRFSAGSTASSAPSAPRPIASRRRVCAPPRSGCSRS